jgi:hypothetical protein
MRASDYARAQALLRAFNPDLDPTGRTGGGLCLIDCVAARLRYRPSTAPREPRSVPRYRPPREDRLQIACANTRCCQLDPSKALAQRLYVDALVGRRKIVGVRRGLDLLLVEIVRCRDIVVVDDVVGVDVIGNLLDVPDGLQEQSPGLDVVPAPTLLFGKSPRNTFASSISDSVAPSGESCCKPGNCVVTMCVAARGF